MRVLLNPISDNMGGGELNPIGTTGGGGLNIAIGVNISRRPRFCFLKFFDKNKSVLLA